MPRYLPKPRRAQEASDDVTDAEPDPTWAPDSPPVRVRGALRVVSGFNCEGVAFRQDQVVSPNDELVQRILAEYPSLFEITSIPES